MISPQILAVVVVLAIHTECKVIPNCTFDNTVDLTGSQEFPNGSYAYNGNILIPQDQVGVYDYEMIFNNQRVARTAHTRGCLCTQRNCIKFCCDPTKEILTNDTISCTTWREEGQLKYDPYINMIYANFSSVRRNAINDFIVLQGIPCENISPLLPDVYSTDQWGISENGGLLLYHGNIVLKRSDYCLMPLKDNEGEWKLTAFICPSPNAVATYNFVWNIFGIISIIFTLVTAVVYILLPELQSVHGECVIHYVLSLAVGNIFMTIISMSNELLPSFLCSFVGFMAYFFYECSFIWVNVIGYDLWQAAQDKRILKKYSAYAYGFAGGMTMILLILQYSEMPEQYKPGIGGGVCWLNTTNWSAMLYFFGVNAIIFCLNVILYRRSSQKEMPILWKHDEITRFTHTFHLKSIRTYFLLLCILGASWCLSTGSYIQDLVDPSGVHVIRYMSDIMNSLEGPLLFWVLLVKTDTIYLLIRRKTTGSAYQPQLAEYSEEEFTSQF